MNEPITYITSNETKFEHAELMLEPYGITLRREHLEIQEIQADGEAICRQKALDAYSKLQKNIVVNDDTWVIPGLQGFPGAYMKYVNQWFTSADWLRLTAELEDRRILLHQHIVYQNSDGQHYFFQEIEGLLLSEARGKHEFTHLTIASFDGGERSGAERVESGSPVIDHSIPTAWHHFGEWMTGQ